MMETPGGQLTGIRSQLPPRATDLSNTDNMLLPNAQGMPGFSPNVPIAGGPSINGAVSSGGAVPPSVGMIAGQTLNNAPGVPVINAPSADMGLMLTPSAQYHPAALNAVGAGGGSSSQDLLGMQLAMQTQGVDIPAIPKLVRKTITTIQPFTTCITQSLPPK